MDQVEVRPEEIEEDHSEVEYLVGGDFITEKLENYVAEKVKNWDKERYHKGRRCGKPTVHVEPPREQADSARVRQTDDLLSLGTLIMARVSDVLISSPLHNILKFHELLGSDEKLWIFY